MGSRTPEPLEILKAAWSIGAVFMLPSQWCQITLQEHAGGEWLLQHSMDKGETWYDVKGEDSDTALVWDTKAIQTIRGSAGLYYRLNGGDAGAIAFALAAGVLDTEDANFFGVVQAGS